MSTNYPDLPEGITSFGAALTGGAVYVYGGHCGAAHDYYTKGQSNRLWRLNLAEPSAWEELPTGPRLQGLALVAHGGMLYRVGGFSARNEKGDDQDLWSVADVARFDPAAGAWETLTPLPSPRSSHDAAVIGDELYVVGGWTLSGKKESTWHATAWVADLSQSPLKWRELPPPPFRRRALAVAALDGKLYVIGGMREQGGPTDAVTLFDPETQTWSSAPDLQGPPDEGFGAAACAAGDALYVSTVQGHLQSWRAGDKAWAIAQKLPTSRFFHRMLPIAADRLMILGGANMETGRFRQVDVVELQQTL